MFSRKPPPRALSHHPAKPVPPAPPPIPTQGQRENAPAPTASLTSKLAQVPVPKASIEASPEEGHVTIGKGCRVHGKVADCRKLSVYGILEADVVADTLVVHKGGGISGTVHANDAEIHGVVEGTLVVRAHLAIEGTGHVTGDIRYRTLAMKTGARLHGNIVCSEAEGEPTAEVIPINGAHQNGSNGLALGLPIVRPPIEVGSNISRS